MAPARLLFLVAACSLVLSCGVLEAGAAEVGSPELSRVLALLQAAKTKLVSDSNALGVAEGARAVDKVAVLKDMAILNQGPDPQLAQKGRTDTVRLLADQPEVTRLEAVVVEDRKAVAAAQVPTIHETPLTIRVQSSTAGQNLNPGTFSTPFRTPIRHATTRHTRHFTPPRPRLLRPPPQKSQPSPLHSPPPRPLTRPRLQPPPPQA